MKLKEYLKELSIVILGILVAFWINNLSVSFKESRVQDQGLSIILSELEENREEIIKTLPQLDTLEQTIKRLSESDSSRSGTNVNYSLLTLKDSGFESAKFTSIFSEIDYNIASKIVEIYQDQQSLLSFENRLIDELFTLMRNREKYPKEDFRFFLMLINNLKSNLKDLKSDLDESIEIVESEI